MSVFQKLRKPYRAKVRQKLLTHPVYIQTILVKVYIATTALNRESPRQGLRHTQTLCAWSSQTYIVKLAALRDYIDHTAYIISGCTIERNI